MIQDIQDLILYLKNIREKDAVECDKIIDLLADYHIEATKIELEFWNKFLLAWKLDIN